MTELDTPAKLAAQTETPVIRSVTFQELREYLVLKGNRRRRHSNRSVNAQLCSSLGDS